MEHKDEFAEIEYKLLCRAIVEACGLLGMGDEFAGYRCLTTGWERVQELAREGELWASELATAYLAALESYTELPRGRRSLIGTLPEDTLVQQGVFSRPTGATTSGTARRDRGASRLRSGFRGVESPIRESNHLLR